MKKHFCFIFILFFAVVLTARDLKTNDGKVYIDIQIIGVKPNGLDIIHTKGAALVPFGKLSKEIQQEFNYNPVAAAEYEHKLEVEKQKKGKELALKRKQEEEQKKEEAKKRGELAKESLDKIREKVYSKGVPVTLNRKVLFKIVTGNPIFASSELLGKSSVFPAYGKYMVVNKKVYLVKNNVISLTDKLTEVEEKIPKAEEIVDQLQDIVLKCDQQIDDNIKKIREIVGITSIKRSDFYNDKGKYIGTVETYEKLSDLQIELVEALHLANKKLDIKISNAEKDILSLESKIKEMKEEQITLKKQVDVFNANQKKYLENVAVKKAVDEKKKEEKKVPEDIESKLEKLKEMHEKGLIPKDLYDKKIAEIIDEYVKE